MKNRVVLPLRSSISFARTLRPYKSAQTELAIAAELGVSNADLAAWAVEDTWILRTVLGRYLSRYFSHCPNASGWEYMHSMSERDEHRESNEWWTVM